MAEINVLDKKIAELIAAGEVVDRPASVVKELVENSIDAGAQIVTIEIKNGGISYIRISDNGSGIEKTEIRKAFLRHATSKIKAESDLDKILTLGFRGEALASVAAMCRVEVTTKTYESLEGVRYVIEGGEEKTLDEAGCPTGTTIIIRDIFYNTPARMKFLKKDVTEGNSVATIIEKIALSHPEVSIKFIRDGVIKLQTPGDNRLISAISAVYGREFAKSLVEVKPTIGKFVVEGYVSKPEKCKNSRRFQNFFINSRYVKSVTSMVALEEAYKNSVMVGKTPACVLNIKLPPDFVDVNVHPAKIEVRFSDEKQVFDSVYNSVKNSLYSYDSIGTDKQEKILKTKNEVNPFTINSTSMPEQQRFMNGVGISEFKDIISEKKNSDKAKVSVNDVSDGKFYYGKNNDSYIPQDVENVSVVHYDKSTNMPPIGSLATGGSLKYIVNGENIYKNKVVKKFDGETCVEDLADTNKVIIHHMQEEMIKAFDGYKKIPEDFLKSDVRDIKRKSAQKSIDVRRKFESAKIVGELFDTYIMLELDQKLVLVDKHAAHERLLFEQMREGLYKNGIDRQTLLSPLSLRVDLEIYTVFCDNSDIIEKLGFLVDDFGDKTVLIREIPMFIDISNAEDILCSIGEALLKNKSDLTPEAYDDLLHSMACKAAVKANDKNSNDELSRIIELLDENDDVKYCPHGRPIYISATKREIEKQFGRTK